MSCNKKHPKFRIHCGLPEGHEGDHREVVRWSEESNE